MEQDTIKVILRFLLYIAGSWYLLLIRQKTWKGIGLGGDLEELIGIPKEKYEIECIHLEVLAG